MQSFACHAKQKLTRAGCTQVDFQTPPRLLCGSIFHRPCISEQLRVFVITFWFHDLNFIIDSGVLIKFVNVSRCCADCYRTILLLLEIERLNDLPNKFMVDDKLNALFMKADMYLWCDYNVGKSKYLLATVIISIRTS